MALATAGLDTPDTIATAASDACRQTLDRFRGEPNGLGRARMYAGRSVGIDDPGMLAVQVMVSALADD